MFIALGVSIGSGSMANLSAAAGPVSRLAGSAMIWSAGKKGTAARVASNCSWLVKTKIRSINWR